MDIELIDATKQRASTNESIFQPHLTSTIDPCDKPEDEFLSCLDAFRTRHAVMFERLDARREGSGTEVLTLHNYQQEEEYCKYK